MPIRRRRARASRPPRRRRRRKRNPSGLSSTATALPTTLIYKQQNYADAIAALRTLGRDDHPDVANLIGFSSRKLGRTEDAKVWYETALAADPKHTRTWQYYGMWHLEQGDRAKAEEHLERIRTDLRTGLRGLRVAARRARRKYHVLNRRRRQNANRKFRGRRRRCDRAGLPEIDPRIRAQDIHSEAATVSLPSPVEAAHDTPRSQCAIVIRTARRFRCAASTDDDIGRVACFKRHRRSHPQCRRWRRAR